MVDTIYAALDRGISWLTVRLRRRSVAVVACVLLAGAVLLPCLGSAGLWEPQERALADKVAPPLSIPSPPKLPPAPDAKTPDCLTTVPTDATARTLTASAIVFGRDHVADSDAGRRLPLALMGLLTILACAGITMRLASARAGVFAAAIGLSMPLLVFQSRFLTSEIGTPCGAALIVYALVALAKPRGASLVFKLGDLIVSTVALIAGVEVGFHGGGALLGLVVPLGAVAAAGGLGMPLVVGGVTWLRSLKQRRDERAPVAVWEHLPALLATAAAIALLGLLAYHLYDIRVPRLAAGMVPPARQIAGHAIVNDGCYSWALGAVWKVDDDTRFAFDSTFEQAAYGTYPWGMLAPIAMIALLRDRDPRRRTLGAITLAWAGGAWIANEVWSRKVGVAIFAGFPPLAIALGAWVEQLFAARFAEREPEDGIHSRGSGLLLGLFLFLAALAFGKDVQSFLDKAPGTPGPTLMALVSGSDLTYPNAAHFLLLKTRLWVLVFGLAVSVGFGVALGVKNRKLARLGAIIAVGATVALDLFWPFGWQRSLSEHVSSKALFDTYHDLRKSGDTLVIQGDLGQAPTMYADAKPELVTNRQQVVAALQRPERVFAIAPVAPAEFCALNREMGDKPYFVLDDRNVKSYLLSNQVTGTTDKNPLLKLISRKEPTVRVKPKGRVVWDNKIELIGFDLPAKLPRKGKFVITTYYKILNDVNGQWKMLVHVDGPGGRLRDGDHPPIGDRCPTSTWKAGDYVTDRFVMSTKSGSYTGGSYDVWIGFFTGSSPSFKNMPISEAPADMRDTNDRVKLDKLSMP